MTHLGPGMARWGGVLGKLSPCLTARALGPYVGNLCPPYHCAGVLGMVLTVVGGSTFERPRVGVHVDLSECTGGHRRMMGVGEQRD